MKLSVGLLIVWATLVLPSVNAFTGNPINRGLDKIARSSVVLSDTKKDMLEYRFNKCPPIEAKYLLEDADRKLYLEGVHKNVFPLIKSDYATELKDKADIMRFNTTSESIVLKDDVGLHDDYKGQVVDLFFVDGDPVTDAKIIPLYPGDRRVVDGKNVEFWDEFEEVINARVARLEKIPLPNERDLSESIYSWPELWCKKPTISPWVSDDTTSPSASDDTTSPSASDDNKPPLYLEDIAQSVKGEFSNYHQQAFLIDIRKKPKLSERKSIKLSDGLGNDERCKDDFLANPIRMAALNAWSLDVVGPVNFNLKWHFGVPRPEEVAWKIHKGDWTTEIHDVPIEIVTAIKGMKLTNAADFTAYKGEGSPRHPSFPAMHSAGSTCSLWVPTLYDISPDQYLEALRTDYGVAFARTVAGVHYPQDNLAGLNIGQRVIREKLPEFLRATYGYDSDLVEEQVKALSFDWNKVTFTDDGCNIDGVPHNEFLVMKKLKKKS